MKTKLVDSKLITMSEREKLRNGLMADIKDPELQALLHRAKSLLPKFNACYLHGPGYEMKE